MVPPTGLVNWRTRMSNDLVKRLMWSGLLAVVGAATTVAANRLARLIWRRAFNEDPPEFT